MGDFTSFIIKANIDPRTSTTTIQRYNPIAVGGITGGFTSSHAAQLSFLSRLKITLWKRAGEKKSSVMFEAVPVEARNMIEAQWDMYIGHDWWGEVNGKREAELVKIYKMLAEDMEYKRQSVKGK